MVSDWSRRIALMASSIRLYDQPEPKEEETLDTDPSTPFVKPPFNPNEINLN